MKHGWFAVRDAEPFPCEGMPSRVWGNGLYPTNFSPAKHASSLVTNFHITDYVFHHFGYHEKGVLSADIKAPQDATVAKYKRVHKPLNVTASLRHFLETYNEAVVFNLMISRNASARDIARFAICKNQRPKDALSDFNIHNGVEDDPFAFVWICDEVDRRVAEGVLEGSYKCSENRSSEVLPHRMIETFKVQFTAYDPHTVVLREGYPDEFFADCACSRTTHCTSDQYNQILSHVQSITSRYYNNPVIQSDAELLVT